MSGPFRRLLLALVAALPAASTAAADEARSPVADRLAEEAGLTVTRIAGPAQSYARNCQGCHGHLGASVLEVPTLKGRVGYFPHTPEGRAYIVRVPGVALAHLSDAELAGLLNWMLLTYSAAELPADFTPYEAAEVARLRARPLDSVLRERNAVIEGLVGAGALADPDLLGFGTELRY